MRTSHRAHSLRAPSRRRAAGNHADPRTFITAGRGLARFCTPALLLPTMMVSMIAMIFLVHGKNPREGGGDAGVPRAGGGRRFGLLPLFLATATATATTSRGVMPYVFLAASLPATGATTTENCVVCGTDPATSCPCTGCTGSLDTVDCSANGIKSLSKEPIVLPEGKTVLSVGRQGGRERASLFHPRYVSILIILATLTRNCLPSCLPVRLCLMISRCAALLHLCDWLAICLSGWNAGTGASATTPCPSSLPPSSRGSQN